MQPSFFTTTQFTQWCVLLLCIKTKFFHKLAGTYFSTIRQGKKFCKIFYIFYRPFVFFIF